VHAALRQQRVAHEGSRRVVAQQVAPRRQRGQQQELGAQQVEQGQQQQREAQPVDPSPARVSVTAAV